MRAPIQRNKKGIPAGVITRKDALMRDDIVVPARRQRRMGVTNYSEAGRNDTAKHSSGRHSQQFDIVRGKSIDFETKKARRGRTYPCKAIEPNYSIVLS